MNRRLTSILLALTALFSVSSSFSAQAPPPKVLKYAFPVAETGFDPTQLSDIYSRIATGHIFESLYGFDPLARPAKIVPLIADGEAQTSPDFKTFTIHLKHGVYFADDAAFKGNKREVTAQDFVYSYKRFADPALKSQGWSGVESAGLVGLSELRERSIKGKTAFAYDSEIEGLRALDRYTLQFKTKEARPRLVEAIMAGSDIYGAVAREVVDFYGDKTGEHPVGTGPFVLKSWRRSSQMIFVKNPTYRERYYEGSPAPDDAEAQALLARFKGRRIPMIDQVEISIIEEPQPRWLSFLNAQHDFLDRVPEAFFAKAMPGNELAPYLVKRGIHAVQTLAPDILLSVFNMENPVVGGYTPEKVALRRALGLAFDVPREIRLVRNNTAIVAQSIILPNTIGYDPAFKSEMGDYDPARAKALLDLYGYVDRKGDGWRSNPDGSPLVIERRTQSDGLSRQLDEIWDKSMSAIGIKMKLVVAQWPENLKNVQSGNFMMWDVGSLATEPDGQESLQRLYGPGSGTQDIARFKSAEFDKVYEQMSGIPDGPQREALFLQAKRISIAYAPYKERGHRIFTDLAQPWLIGYRRPLFWLDWWEYVDIDESKKPRP